MIERVPRNLRGTLFTWIPGPGYNKPDKRKRSWKRGMAMFWYRRRRPQLWTWILAWLGLRWMVRTAWLSEEERERFKSRRHLFREKLREAFRVWQEPVAPQDREAAEDAEMHPPS